MKDTSPPSPVLALLEGRALLSAGALPWWLPAYRSLPEGDGHSVLVLPGFLADSRSTAPLRWFLKEKGYTPHRWRMGRNLGYSPELSERMNERVRELFKQSGRKVSLVGWSLGGVYAREIAREQPDKVRLAISMGSPFGGAGLGSNVSEVYRLINGELPQNIEKELLLRMESPPPVPTSSIFSRTDGVVSWRVSLERIEHSEVENVGVFAAHLGLGVSPAAWITIADRLAQPEGQWRPFRPKGLARFLFESLESVAFHGDPKRPRFRLA